MSKDLLDHIVEGKKGFEAAVRTSIRQIGVGPTVDVVKTLMDGKEMVALQFVTEQAVILAASLVRTRGEAKAIETMSQAGVLAEDMDELMKLARARLEDGAAASRRRSEASSAARAEAM
jgi:hypothetical protein